MFSLKKILIATALTLSSLSAHAGFISSDWLTPGDNLISTDTNTGLQWLDLTVTMGKTYDGVQTMLDKGGAATGWRLATFDEVTSLWDSLFPGSPTEQITGSMDDITGVSAEAAFAWLDAFGFYEEGTPDFDYSVGLVLDDLEQSRGFGFIIKDNGEGHFVPGVVAQTAPHLGVFLVSGDNDTQPSAVPLPGAAILFLLALAGLSISRMRKD